MSKALIPNNDDEQQKQEAAKYDMQFLGHLDAKNIDEIKATITEVSLDDTLLIENRKALLNWFNDMIKDSSLLEQEDKITLKNQIDTIMKTAEFTPVQQSEDQVIIPNANLSAQKQLEYTKGLVKNTDELLNKTGVTILMVDSIEPKPGTSPAKAAVDKNYVVVLDAIAKVATLGGENFRNYLPDDKINALVKNINEGKTKLLAASNDISQKDKEQLELAAARAEGSLKGFQLSHDVDGHLRKYKDKGLTADDLNKAYEITNKVLLELSGKGIPRAEYADKVIARARESLIEANMDPEKILIFKELMTNEGKQASKPNAEILPEQTVQIIDKMSQAADEMGNLIVNAEKQEVKAAIVDRTIHSRLLDSVTGLNEAEKENLGAKLGGLKELWGYEQANYTNPDKQKYLTSNTTKIETAKNAEEAFNQIGKLLIDKSTPEQQAAILDKLPDSAQELKSYLASKLLLDQAISDLEKSSGKPIKDEDKKQIKEALLPTLQSLGSEYLKDNNKKITEELSQSLDGAKNFLQIGSDTIKFDRDDLGEKLKKTSKEIEEQHLKPSKAKEEKEAQLQKEMDKSQQEEKALYEQLKKVQEGITLIQDKPSKAEELERLKAQKAEISNQIASNQAKYAKKYDEQQHLQNPNLSRNSPTDLARQENAETVKESTRFCRICNSRFVETL